VRRSREGSACANAQPDKRIGRDGKLHPAAKKPKLNPSGRPRSAIGSLQVMARQHTVMALKVLADIAKGGDKGRSLNLFDPSSV
jgi:hypothetical protein